MADICDACRCGCEYFTNSLEFSFKARKVKDVTTGIFVFDLTGRKLGQATIPRLHEDSLFIFCEGLERY